MLAQLPDLTRLLPFAAFGVVAAGAWALIRWLAPASNRAEQRLARLHRQRSRSRANGGADDRASAMTDWLKKATPQLAKPLQPMDEQEAGKLRMRLFQGGFRSELAPALFSSLKLLGLLAGLAACGVVYVSSDYNTTLLLRAAVGAGIAFFLPDFVLTVLTKRRKKQLFLGLPDAIDLMVVCMEAGLGLDQAMRRVAEEMAESHPLLAHEFGIANLQLQMGVNRVQVLRDLGTRNGEDDLRGFCSVLLQAVKFGSGVGQALRVHSDAMRTRRRQMAEEAAAKCAVKLIFPLVLFIFPGIFVVLVGPAAVAIVRNLMPAMGG